MGDTVVSLPATISAPNLLYSIPYIWMMKRETQLTMTLLSIGYYRQKEYTKEYMIIQPAIIADRPHDFSRKNLFLTLAQNRKWNVSWWNKQRIMSKKKFGAMCMWWWFDRRKWDVALHWTLRFSLSLSLSLSQHIRSEFVFLENLVAHSNVWLFFFK